MFKENIVKNDIWNERIRARLEELRVSQWGLADTLNVSQSRISNYINGTREPDYEMLSKIFNELGLSANWVLLGEQDTSVYSSFPKNIADKYQGLSNSDKKKIQIAIEVLALPNEH